MGCTHPNALPNRLLGAGNFFASDGKTIIHPEPQRFFEVPIQGPLPEELNYIP